MCSTTAFDNKKTKSRSRNFMEFEKKFLLDIITSNFLKVLENKKTDGVSVNHKNKAWDEITEIFNGQAQTGLRTAKQLHALYDNLRKNNKKESCKTGNGTFLPKTIGLDENIVSVLRPQFQPLEHTYDSSSSFVMNVASELTQPQVTREQIINTCPSPVLQTNIEEIPASPLESDTSDENNVIHYSDAEIKIEGPSIDFYDINIEKPSTDINTVGPYARGKKRPAALSERKRKCIKIVQRRNCKEKRDEEVYEKKKNVLQIEKRIKLRQLEILEEQAVMQQKIRERELEAANVHVKLKEKELELCLLEVEIKKKTLQNLNMQ